METNMITPQDLIGKQFYTKDRPANTYTIVGIENNKLQLAWNGETHHTDYKISDANKYLNDGTWITVKDNKIDANNKTILDTPISHRS